MSKFRFKFRGNIAYEAEYEVEAKNIDEAASIVWRLINEGKLTWVQKNQSIDPGEVTVLEACELTNE